MAEEDGQSRGIKSLDAALRVLAFVASRGGPASLSEIARECAMPPSKVHRYLATFIHAGLVRQGGKSGKYDLGPEALQLGLSAIARHDFVNSTADALPDLAAETGMTVLLSVWGNEGATVVRWERSASPTVTSMGLGTTLPLLNSATGRAFLAWAPPASIAKHRDAEMRRMARNPGLSPDFKPTPSGIVELAAAVRARGFGSVDGRFIPGLVAAAAPILDWQGEAQAVVTIVGIDPDWVTPTSPPVTKLKAFCAENSVRPIPA